MQRPPISVSRIRAGALALGASALLLAVFPIVRPFFPLDPRSPGETLAAASPVVTSPAWVIAHLLCTVAFLLLLYGFAALYASHANGAAEPRALRATVISVAGVTLIFPMLGVETFVLPILGAVYTSGANDIAPAVQMIYAGPAMAVFGLALALLAVGAILFASVIWKTGVLPRWPGLVFAVGLTLWFPPFPRAVRIMDGLLIGIGGLWLASSLWQRTLDTDQKTPK